MSNLNEVKQVIKTYLDNRAKNYPEDRRIEEINFNRMKLILKHVIIRKRF